MRWLTVLHHTDEAILTLYNINKTPAKWINNGLTGLNMLLSKGNRWMWAVLGWGVGTVLQQEEQLGTTL